MSGRLASTDDVRDGDAVALPSFGSAVDADDRRRGGVGRDNTVERREDDDSRRQKRAQVVKVGGLFRRIVVRVAEDEAEGVFVGYVFDPTHHRWEEWIGDVRNDHADKAGAIEAEARARAGWGDSRARAIASRTRFFNVSRTGAVSFRKCDTVPSETCAALAIWCMVTLGLASPGRSLLRLTMGMALCISSTEG